MRIAINALSARTGGGISAFLNLLPALHEADKNNEYLVYVSADQREIISCIPKGFKTVTLNAPGNPYARVLFEQLVFPALFIFHGIELLYSVGNTTILLATCKIVLLIENASPYSHLNRHKGSDTIRNFFLRMLTWFSVKRADAIRFVSENSKDIIASRLKIPLQKCFVIHHGFKNEAGARDSGKPVDGNYILYVSTVMRHKNMEQLIKGFHLFSESTGYKGKLLITGGIHDQGYYKNLKLLCASLGIQEKVIFTGSIEFRKIGNFYSGAEAFVFPSVEETFGMPVIEAMGYGVPMAVSEAPRNGLKKELFIPFQEFCGDAALYFLSLIHICL